MGDATTITTSAPGSLMLLGEHAVLHGHQSIVCAINRRITIHLDPTEGDIIDITSDLANYRSPLANLVGHPSLKFVIQAIEQHREHIPSGFNLRINSEFSADIGFGSSAAVTVAVHAAVLSWIEGVEPEREQLFAESLKTVQAVQGRGSGADLAASIFGGVVGYSIGPEFQPVQISVPLTAVYCGYKVPTPEVILHVEQLRMENIEKFNRIYGRIDQSVEEAIACLNKHDFPGFGNILNGNQFLMDEMGVNTPELDEIVSALQRDPEIFGAKISGSGMGDCAVGIGAAELKELDYPVHHLEITPAGCQYHE